MNKPSSELIALADEFNGDNATLIDCIKAQIKLSDDGALVPHGLSANARTMLAAAAIRLASSPSNVREALDLLQLEQRGRAQAFRLLDKARPVSDPATLAKAGAYEECGNELKAALSLRAVRIDASEQEAALGREDKIGAAETIPGDVVTWSCGSCGDSDVPEKFRVFGSCYKCATQRSLNKRNRKIASLQAAIDRLDATSEPKPQEPDAVAVIRLRPAEIQSGHDRVQWAEGLIRQLHENHDGRNSWLLNYAGEKHKADKSTHPTTKPEAQAVSVDAIEDIAAERQRQISVEGWTPEHDDDAHCDGELAEAAACYARGSDRVTLNLRMRGLHYRYMWPWDASWWKPKDRRTNLIRAGALIVAEIERLDRAALFAGGR